MKKFIMTMWLILAVTLLTSVSASAKTYTFAWSHYTGWEPWGYAQDLGIVDKWAKRYGVSIKVVRINNYIESINLYTSGQFDGCAMTNMDALTIPAVGGRNSTALIVGDFSNGNDGVVIKGKTSVKKGDKIMLVELSVSHYMFSKYLEKVNLRERDIVIINTDENDIGPVFLSQAKSIAVTWNPILMGMRNGRGVKMLFDSSQIPGEIIDMMVVRTDLPDKVKRAITGAWYETMSIMSKRNKTSKSAITYMAIESGATFNEFRAQLRTTAMFYKADEAADFTKSKELVATMDSIRKFSYEHGLFGEGSRTLDFVGIEFPNNVFLGDKNNIMLHFDATYMQLAADGQL